MIRLRKNALQWSHSLLQLCSTESSRNANTWAKRDKKHSKVKEWAAYRVLAFGLKSLSILCIFHSLLLSASLGASLELNDSVGTFTGVKWRWRGRKASIASSMRYPKSETESCKEGKESAGVVNPHEEIATDAAKNDRKIVNVNDCRLLCLNLLKHSDILFHLTDLVSRKDAF